MSTPETPLVSRATLELIAAQLRAARAAGMAAVESASAGLLALAPLLGAPGAPAGPLDATAAAVSAPRRLTREEIQCFGGQKVAAAPAPSVTPPAANSSE